MKGGWEACLAGFRRDTHVEEDSTTDYCLILEFSHCNSMAWMLRLLSATVVAADDFVWYVCICSTAGLTLLLCSGNMVDSSCAVCGTQLMLLPCHLSCATVHMES